MPESLFPYQEVGAQFLAARPQAFLADQQRVGKTPQAIRACDLVGAERILVLCPAIARSNWVREFERFSVRARTPRPIMTSADSSTLSSTCICSYDLIVGNSVKSRLQSVCWDVVILDEAHYLKNAGAQRTRVAYQQLTARYWWRLSGTPAPNHYGELYTHCKTMGRWPHNYQAFLKTFCKTIETPYGVQVVGNKSHAELQRLLEPVLLRRKLEDVVSELPPMQFDEVVVEAAEVDAARWWPSVMLKHETREQVLERVQSECTAIQAVLDLTKKQETGSDTLAALQGAKTITSRRWIGLQKVPAVAEILTQELLAGDYRKLVVFAWHKDVIHFLTEKLQQFHPLVIYGGTPALKRDIHIHKFKTQAKFQVLIGNIQAAGTAIDLSVAHEVAFVEASWVPGENAQAAMRVHHLKQTHPVRVRFFSLADSIDTRIQSILRRKTRDLTALFDEPTPVSPFE